MRTMASYIQNSTIIFRTNSKEKLQVSCLSFKWGPYFLSFRIIFRVWSKLLAKWFLVKKSKRKKRIHTLVLKEIIRNLRKFIALDLQDSQWHVLCLKIYFEYPFFYRMANKVLEVEVAERCFPGRKSVFGAALYKHTWAHPFNGLIP